TVGSPRSGFNSGGLVPMGDANDSREDATASAMPMFPLSMVLFPGAPLPLRVFEERYQQLVKDTVDRGRAFGVVLISRGSEVGGGDQRLSIGTLAEIEA